ncbi:MBL fold metallo-hydrolase [Oceanobacillus halophilus]|uniref:MBL fold metallo-hydrolase n=1 Tax=Oceanobacillus halophilus TaxID=930130 RepID=A0A495A0C7_9BACI|nr:MBL fold metallo-hydrolase [Oceanobacillus halophilus]RKQ32721.1 MBL fold metallo-hydrolase [Oceanobacillus halophilus]
MSIFKVIRVPIPTPTLYPHTTTNCYLIGNDQDCLLVDAGYDVMETRTLLEEAIKENGLAIPQRIILTHHHPDHAPGVKQLTDWSPIIYCHEKEKEEIITAISPLEKVSHLSDGELIPVAGEKLQIIHGPGHTAGHLSVYLPSPKILIAGDNIVAEGTTWIGPPDGDMIDYLQTLNRLENLKLSKIGPGHGNWVFRPYEHIEFVRNRRLHREEQIKSLLQEHKHLTSAQLTEFIYNDSIHPSIFQVAKRTTEAHLIKLMKEGAVTLEDSAYSIVS